MNLYDLLELTYNRRWAHAKDGEGSRRNALDAVRFFTDSSAMLVSDIGRREIVEWATLLGTRYKPATVNRKLSSLRAMFTEAEEAGIIEQVPRFPKRRPERKRSRWLTQEEFNEFTKALRAIGRPLKRVPVLQAGWQVAALADFLVATGVRLGEALGIRWENVGPVGVELRQTKNGRPRLVPLTEGARRVLDEQNAVLSGTRYRAGPFEHLRPGDVTYAWNQAKAMLPWAADDPDVVPHCLRHTTASRLVSNGVPIYEVAHLLGHTRIESTQRYAHLSKGRIDALRGHLEAVS